MLNDQGRELTVSVRLIAGLRRFLPPGPAIDGRAGPGGGQGAARAAARAAGSEPDGGLCRLSLSEGATVGDALAQLGLPESDAYVVLLNGRDARLDDPLHEGDQVAAFPRLAGG